MSELVAELPGFMEDEVGALTAELVTVVGADWQGEALARVTAMVWARLDTILSGRLWEVPPPAPPASPRPVTDILSDGFPTLVSPGRLYDQDSPAGAQA